MISVGKQRFNIQIFRIKSNILYPISSTVHGIVSLKSSCCGVRIHTFLVLPQEFIVDETFRTRPDIGILG